MTMCSKSWKGVGCVSEALPGRDVCAVHAKRPEYAPPTGELAQIDFDDPLVIDHAFSDDADCSDCDGSGDCECHCGDIHDCEECSGSGKVFGCRFCEGALGDNMTDARKRRHLKECGAKAIFVEHMASNMFTPDEKKLYDDLLKEIGPEAATDPDDCAVTRAK